MLSKMEGFSKNQHASTPMVPMQALHAKLSPVPNEPHRLNKVPLGRAMVTHLKGVCQGRVGLEVGLHVRLQFQGDRYISSAAIGERFQGALSKRCIIQESNECPASSDENSPWQRTAPQLYPTAVRSSAKTGRKGQKGWMMGTPTIG